MTQPKVVDARPILAAGGEPFSLIMGAVASLEEGQSLVVLAPFEPVPLEGVLGEQGFTFDVEQLEAGDFRVTFTPEQA